MWPGSVEISKQTLEGHKWGASNSSTLSDSNPWHAKDSMTTGWGSVNQSPVPNAGTEGWSSALNQQLQQNNANGPMLPQQPLERTSHSNFNSNHPQQTANSASAWGANSGLGPAGAWSRGNPMSSCGTNQASTSSASNQTPGSGGPSSWAEAVANKQSGSGPGSLGSSCTSVSTATGQPGQVVAQATDEAKAKKTQEELIAIAINSNEGWGKTVIRQDTAWIVDDPPAPNEASRKDPHSDHDQHGSTALTSKQILTGTAIWESLKAPQKPAEMTTPWEAGKVQPAVPNGPVADGRQVPFRQAQPDDKPAPVSANWPGHASANSSLTTSTPSWGSAVGGPSSSDLPWVDGQAVPGVSKKDEERPSWGSSGGEVASKPPADLGIGCWERNGLPLHRSSSTGSWIEEAVPSDVANGGSGAWAEDKTNNPSSVLREIDDGTSLWGDPGQNKSQQLGWRPNSVLSSKVPGMRKSESEVFNPAGVGNPLSLKLGFGVDDHSRTWNASLPPQPSTETSGWGASDMKDASWMGLLNHNQRLKPPFRANSDINDWSALSNTRTLFDKGQPPQRSALLQKLINLGFKKEEAQAALISNNMNYDEAMTMLLKAKVPGNPLILDHALSSSAAPVQGRFNMNSSRGIPGGMEEFLGIESAPLDLIGLSSLSINSNSAGGINGINSSLVNQIRGNVGNAALHQFASSLGNHNLDISALLNSGSVIPQLQTPKPLAPHVASQQQQQQQHNNNNRPMPSLPQQHLVQSVQSAVQLGLLPAQAVNQHSLSNPNFYASLQLLLKLNESQKLLVQSMQQVPPPGHAPGSVLCQQQICEWTAVQQHMESVKQQLLQMAAPGQAPALPPSSGRSAGVVAPSSRLISQWKVQPEDDASAAAADDLETLRRSSSLLDRNDPGPPSDPTEAWLPMTSAPSWPNPDSSCSSTSGGALDDRKRPLPSSSSATAQTSSPAAAPIGTLDIEEFIPGKPWQGPGTKNVEDDPYLTPGSIARNSISTVKDSQAASILGRANRSIPSDSSPANNSSNNSLELRNQIPSFSSSKLGSHWAIPDSRPSDPWPGQPFSGNKSAGQWNAVNRSISWASGDRADCISNSASAMSTNWPMSSSPPSNWLLIKSSPQVDSMNLQSLCHHYGGVTSFTPNFYQGQSLVLYARAEDALKAYRGINSYRPGNFRAEFISDAEVGQVVGRIHQQQQQQLAPPTGGFQQSGQAMGSGPMGNGSLLGNGPAFFGKLPLSVPPGGDPSLLASLRAPPHWSAGSSGMGHLWNNPASPAGQQSLWGGPMGLEDHDHGVFLPGDLLGNQ